MHQLTAKLDSIARNDRLPCLRRFAINIDAPGGDQFFHLAARTDAALREQLVQPLGFARQFLVTRSVGEIGLGRARRPPRLAVATTLKPEAQVKPVFMPLTPE